MVISSLGGHLNGMTAEQELELATAPTSELSSLGSCGDRMRALVEQSSAGRVGAPDAMAAAAVLHVRREIGMTFYSVAARVTGGVGQTGVMVGKIEHTAGAFLRNRRERMDPAMAAPVANRRRTPGWRREEVAHRAGVSVEWYTRLEQGRGGSPSSQVLDSIASALELSLEEREHLFDLAGLAPAPGATARPEGHVERLRKILDGFSPGPAFVKTASWDVVAWNEAARRVLSDYPSMSADMRNVLRILFLEPSARERLDDWEGEARLTLSTLRFDLARGAADPTTVAVIEGLRETSTDFARLWAAHDVGRLGEGVKHLTHPLAGRLTLQYSSFAIEDAPGLSLVLYTPVTPDDAKKIERLLSC